jgi:hypothetical protein
MLLGAWQFLGLLALVTTGAAVLSRADEAIFGTTGAILWWVWGFGATNLVSEAGQSSELALALVGALLGLLSLVIGYAGAVSFLAPLSDDPMDGRPR